MSGMRNIMLGWLSRCWGGFGVSSQFERARLRSVITDWKVPEDADLCILINSFKGQNPEIAQETAVEMFFTHMQVRLGGGRWWYGYAGGRGEDEPDLPAEAPVHPGPDGGGAHRPRPHRRLLQQSVLHLQDRREHRNHPHPRTRSRLLHLPQKEGRGLRAARPRPLRPPRAAHCRRRGRQQHRDLRAGGAVLRPAEAHGGHERQVPRAQQVRRTHPDDLHDAAQGLPLLLLPRLHLRQDPLQALHPAVEVRGRAAVQVPAVLQPGLHAQLRGPGGEQQGGGGLPERQVQRDHHHRPRLRRVHRELHPQHGEPTARTPPPRHRQRG